MPLHTEGAYTFRKEGILHFRRRIPRDLQDHDTSPQIACSLRTRSASVATSRATRAARQLDEYWYHLRLTSRSLPGQHLLRIQRPSAASALPSSHPPQPVYSEPAALSPTLSEAVSIYLRL